MIIYNFAILQLKKQHKQQQQLKPNFSRKNKRLLLYVVVLSVMCPDLSPSNTVNSDSVLKLGSSFLSKLLPIVALQGHSIQVK